MLDPSRTARASATTAPTATPSPSPPRYWSGSGRKAAPAATSANWSASKNSARCTTALAYIPAPKNTTLPNELYPIWPPTMSQVSARVTNTHSIAICDWNCGAMNGPAMPAASSASGPAWRRFIAAPAACG